MMTTSNFDLPVSLRITGDIQSVFQSWVDARVANNWLCDRMEGEWTSGGAVHWCFNDIRQPLRVVRVEQNKLLEFKWNAFVTQPETTVTIEFYELDHEVRIVLRESDFPLTLEAVSSALDRACGWENILCRLKAWTEAKIRLR